MKMNVLSFALIAFLSPMFLFGMDDRWSVIRPRQDIHDELRTYNETKKAEGRLEQQKMFRVALKSEPKGYFRNQLFCDLKYPFDKPIDNFRF